MRHHHVKCLHHQSPARYRVEQDPEDVAIALNGKGWAQLTARGAPVWVNADRVLYFNERPAQKAHGF